MVQSVIEGLTTFCNVAPGDPARKPGAACCYVLHGFVFRDAKRLGKGRRLLGWNLFQPIFPQHQGSLELVQLCRADIESPDMEVQAVLVGLLTNLNILATLPVAYRARAELIAAQINRCCPLSTLAGARRVFAAGMLVGVNECVYGNGDCGHGIAFLLAYRRASAPVCD